MSTLAGSGCAWITDDDFAARMDLDGDGIARPEDCDDADGGIGVAADMYADRDLDGFGAGEPTAGCSLLEGYTRTGLDCDDSRAEVNPAAVESCNGIDDDCDLQLDEPGASGEVDWYLDADGDGYGATGSEPERACGPPEGYASAASDCDDGDPAISPSAAEVGNDGIDQDCSGSDATDYVSAYGVDLLVISAGGFSMGSGSGDASDAYTDHLVTLTHSIWLGRSEVTHAEWAGWTGAPDPTPSLHGAGCDDCPVEGVSWEDSAQYANSLSAAEGLPPCYESDGSDFMADYTGNPYRCPGYRLPTEAEWEYAARADEDTPYAGGESVGEVAWYLSNAGSDTHPVCALVPNAWGLCDMSGNVFEWTNDWHAPGYGGYADGAAATDPPGPDSGSEREARGGYYYGDESYARVTARKSSPPDYRNGGIGFRLARSVTR